MRDAKVAELKTHTRPVLTARLSARELATVFPVEMHPIKNPFELYEPCRAALVQLDGGQYCLLWYAEISRQLMLRIPSNTNASEFLGALFREVPLMRERLLWLRKDARPRRRPTGPPRQEPG
jgi:hypothetical protein